MNDEGGGGTHNQRWDEHILLRMETGTANQCASWPVHTSCEATLAPT
jgi:hypothetical protein